MSFVLKVIVALFVLGIPTRSHPPQTKADYERQLLQIHERSQKVREHIAVVQAEIQEKKSAIQSGTERILDLRNKKYALLQITDQDVADIVKKIAVFDQLLTEYLKHPDSLLVGESTAFSEVETAISMLHTLPVARLRRVASLLERLNFLVEETRNRMNGARTEPELVDTTNNLPLEAISPWLFVDTYTVRGGMTTRESLSSIAQLVYGDATQWTRIYSANKKLIDQNSKSISNVVGKPFFSDPSDLILPGQILTIPR